MTITVLKSKVHRARVTGANVKYEGSLTLDSDVMRAAGLVEYEKILVGNLTNGERFETYVIAGCPGSREVVLNGATAHLGKRRDLLTIMAFGQMTPTRARRFRPKKITLEKV